MMETTPVAFLRIKLEMLVELFSTKGAARNVAQVKEHYAGHIDRLEGTGAPKLSECKNVEREIDAFATTILGVTSLRPLKEQLKRRFGFYRLGEDYESVIARVLKRGTIRTAIEAEMINDVLSSEVNHETLKPDTCAKLERIAGAFAPKKSKRPRP